MLSISAELAIKEFNTKSTTLPVKVIKVAKLGIVRLATFPIIAGSFSEA